MEVTKRRINNKQIFHVSVLHEPKLKIDKSSLAFYMTLSNIFNLPANVYAAQSKALSSYL